MICLIRSFVSLKECARLQKNGWTREGSKQRSVSLLIPQVAVKVKLVLKCNSHLKGWSRFEKWGKDTRWQHKEIWRWFSLLAQTNLKEQCHFSSHAGFFLAPHQETHSLPLDVFLKAAECVRQHKEEGQPFTDKLKWRYVFLILFFMCFFGVLRCSPLPSFRLFPMSSLFQKGKGLNGKIPVGMSETRQEAC